MSDRPVIPAEDVKRRPHTSTGPRVGGRRGRLGGGRLGHGGTSRHPTRRSSSAWIATHISGAHE